MNELCEIIKAGLRKEGGEIILPQGDYCEKLYIDTERITIKGNDTVIYFSDYAKKLFANEEQYGTFRSYTAFFRAEGLSLENLSIENRAGHGEDVGQAVAAYFDCRRGYIKNCVFKGFQDTIFTAPLPEKPIIPNSFKGPGEGRERKPSLLFFENCYIEGDIDFIFGGACAVFENCEIKSLRDGYICAPSTDKEQRYGYIFHNCRFTGEGESYIARPWRKDGACVVLECDIGSNIRSELWHDWDSAEKRASCRFFSDISCTTDFGKMLTAGEISDVRSFIEETRAAVSREK